jgi:hypothetical protein
MASLTSRPDLPLERWLDALAGIGEAVGGDGPVTDLLDLVAPHGLRAARIRLLRRVPAGRTAPRVDDRRLARPVVGVHRAGQRGRPILLDVGGAEEAPASVAFRTGEAVTIGVGAALAELLGRPVLIEDVYAEPPAAIHWDTSDPNLDAVSDVALDGEVVARIHVKADRRGTRMTD